MCVSTTRISSIQDTSFYGRSMAKDGPYGMSSRELGLHSYHSSRTFTKEDTFSVGSSQVILRQDDHPGEHTSALCILRVLRGRAKTQICMQKKEFSLLEEVAWSC